jgi:ubiquitin-activating enzyme E1
MAALFGGILAQEIIKHTGKYSPVKQWLHFDSLEILDEKIPADADPSKMEHSRYEHLIAMFGKAWHEAYMKRNVFVVGCGALGCEYLKMVAMTGLGVKGKVTVTDDDTIELSNLSRQFLFRRRHVNKEKSASAAESVRVMNPELKNTLDAKNIRVEPKTENVFNDKFWDGLDFVINALDNTKARQYIDGKCVLYRKPLFESGTLGTKANNVVCLPDKSPSYSEGVNSGEGQGIAKCTLRNFPSLILHCIEWAREMFDDWFIEGPDCAAKFIKDPAGYLASLKSTPLEELSKLRMVKKWVGLATNPSVEKCAEEAYKLFLACFRNGILDLIHNFPEDSRMTDKETGADLGPFWHGHKRFPVSCEWDPTNDKYVSFIYHATNIFVNQVFDLKTPVDMADIKKIVTSFEVTEWKYSGATVDLDEDEKDGDEKEEAKLDDEDMKEIAALTTELKAVEVKTVSALQAADFEKDDDKNHHIDIIASSTNLRAYNYRIQETTAAHCRMIAGKIIPAIATTTACITGFVGLEVLKRCRNAELEAYRMVTINLAVNNISMELLPDPKKKKSGMDPETYMEMKAVPEGYTTWDCIEIKEPDLTLAGFLETFKKVHHNCTITMLGDKQSGKVYYNDVNKKNDAQMPRKLSDIVTEINKGPIFPEDRNYVVFDSVMVETADQEEGQTPKIKYYFR